MIEWLKNFLSSKENRRIALCSMWLFAVLTACNPSLEQIEGRLSDVESELLDRGDHQREINKEWNIYISHIWEWDEEQMRIMEQWTRRRSKQNERTYNWLLHERNGLLGKRDDKIAEWENYNPNAYDEHQFENSNAAIRESIANRNGNNN